MKIWTLTMAVVDDMPDDEAKGLLEDAGDFLLLKNPNVVVGYSQIPELEQVELEPTITVLNTQDPF